MAIDRSFTVAGHGTVVTGTVASGSVAVGDDLEWLPAGKAVRVRGLHRHDRPVERIGRGLAGGDQPGGRPPRRDPPRPGAGGAGLPAGVAGPLGRGPRLGRRPRGRSGTGAATGVHLGTAEVAATLALLEANELAPGGAAARPALPGRAGGRGPRPAVRGPRGEPARDPGRRPRAPALGPAAPPPGSCRSLDRLGRLALGRPASTAAGRRAGVPGAEALDRAGALCR